jgi:hypothetical protein
MTFTGHKGWFKGLEDDSRVNKKIQVSDTAIFTTASRRSVGNELVQMESNSLNRLLFSEWFKAIDRGCHEQGALVSQQCFSCLSVRQSAALNAVVAHAQQRPALTLLVLFSRLGCRVPAARRCFSFLKAGRPQFYVELRGKLVTLPQ